MTIAEFAASTLGMQMAAKHKWGPETWERLRRYNADVDAALQDLKSPGQRERTYLKILLGLFQEFGATPDTLVIARRIHRDRVGHLPERLRDLECCANTLGNRIGMGGIMARSGDLGPDSDRN